MGLLQPKGPNPHETDVNSPRYTEASKASKRATEMGISGDAATLLGRGFERVFIQSDMEFKTEADTITIEYSTGEKDENISTKEIILAGDMLKMSPEAVEHYLGYDIEVYDDFMLGLFYSTT